MQSNLFFKATVISITAFALSYGCYQLAGNFLQSNDTHLFFNDKIKLSYRTINQAVSLKGMRSLSVVSENAKIYVRHTEQLDGKIEFTTGSDDKNALKIERIDNAVMMKIKDLNSYPDSSVTITLPRGVDVIKIENKAGEVEIDNLELNNLSITTVSGDINLEQVSAVVSNLMTVSGDIEWNGTSKKMEIKTVSGNVDVSSFYSAPDYDVKTVSGDVALVIVKPMNARLNLQSMSGNVSAAKRLNIFKKPGVINVRSISGDITVDEK